MNMDIRKLKEDFLMHCVEKVVTKNIFSGPPKKHEKNISKAKKICIKILSLENFGDFTNINNEIEELFFFIYIEISEKSKPPILSFTSIQNIWQKFRKYISSPIIPIIIALILTFRYPEKYLWN